MKIEATPKEIKKFFQFIEINRENPEIYKDSNKQDCASFGSEEYLDKMLDKMHEGYKKTVQLLR